MELVGYGGVSGVLCACFGDGVVFVRMVIARKSRMGGSLLILFLFFFSLVHPPISSKVMDLNMLIRCLWCGLLFGCYTLCEKWLDGLISIFMGLLLSLLTGSVNDKTFYLFVYRISSSDV